METCDIQENSYIHERKKMYLLKQSQQAVKTHVGSVLRDTARGLKISPAVTIIEANHKLQTTFLSNILIILYYNILIRLPLPISDWPTSNQYILELKRQKLQLMRFSFRF